MRAFPRPTEAHLDTERTPARDTCPECGSTDIAEYRVVSDGGWWNVRKCQACLHSLARTPGPTFGSFVPLSASL